MWGGIPQYNPAKRLREARRRGMKLIVIDPRATEAARVADIHLQCRPGEDPTILAGLLRVVITEGLVDIDFLADHVDGFDAIAAAVQPFTPDYVAQRADIAAAEQLRIRGLGDNAGGMPTAALAEEILLDGDGQVHALFTVGGNPVAAWPDQLVAIEAMEALDLHVTLDIKISATAKLCDYVIAPKLSLEVAGTTMPNEGIWGYGAATTG